MENLLGKAILLKLGQSDIRILNHVMQNTDDHGDVIRLTKHDPDRVKYVRHPTSPDLSCMCAHSNSNGFLQHAHHFFLAIGHEHH